MIKSCLNWKKIIFIILNIFWLSTSDGQNAFNLVPNWSFEIYTNCAGYLNVLSSWYNPCKLFNCNVLTNFEYRNSCNNQCERVPENLSCYSFQYAKSGNGYIGGYFMYNKGNNIRDYAQVRLQQPLQQGHCYYAEFFVSLISCASYSVNNIAMLITNSAVNQPTNGTEINVIPQILAYGNPILPFNNDTVSWVKVSSVFVANGGEQFITIGNFKDDAHTSIAYTNFLNCPSQTYGDYYIDDVSVIPLDSMLLKADAGPDTTITIGDSVFIGSLTNGITDIKWYNASGAIIDTSRPGFFVKPDSSTFYVVEQTVCGNTSSDTVYVTVGVLPLKLVQFTAIRSSLSFGEGQGKVALLRWQTASEFNTSYFSIERSSDGSHYETIGRVVAAGNSSSILNYQFVDKLPVPADGRCYYRLKMIDKEGKYKYSPVRMIHLSAGDIIIITPNPTHTGQINIDFGKAVNSLHTISIMDATGNMIFKKQRINSSIFSTSINGAKGLYFISITDEKTGQKTTRKVILD